MTDNTFVAPDTDDLNAFNDLFLGKAKPAEETVPAPVEVTDDAPSESKEATIEGLEEELVPEPPKRKTAKDRIDELTAEKHEAKREAEAERVARAADKARLEDLEKKLAEFTAKPVVTQPADSRPTSDALLPDGTPKYPLGDFDPHFQRDLTEFTIEQQFKRREELANQKSQEVARQQYVANLDAGWQEKVKAAEVEMPDFRTKGIQLEQQFSNLDPTYGEFLASTIKQMDVGPQVLYHLANNPEEAKAIVAAGPIGAAVALGELKAQFKTKVVTPPRVSNAPTPPPTTRGVAVGGTVAADTDDLDAFSQAFFAKKR